MRRKSSRSKTNPFRILAASLYWEVEWVSRLAVGDETQVSVRTGRMRAALHLQSERVRDYLRWLAERGYISQLEFERGEATFVVRTPATWNWSSPE